MNCRVVELRNCGRVRDAGLPVIVNESSTDCVPVKYQREETADEDSQIKSAGIAGGRCSRYRTQSPSCHLFTNGCDPPLCGMPWLCKQHALVPIRRIHVRMRWMGYSDLCGWCGTAEWTGQPSARPEAYIYLYYIGTCFRRMRLAEFHGILDHTVIDSIDSAKFKKKKTSAGWLLPRPYDFFLLLFLIIETFDFSTHKTW